MGSIPTCEVPFDGGLGELAGKLRRREECARQESPAGRINSPAPTRRDKTAAETHTIDDVTVTEYHHFISFEFSDRSGAKVFVQYRIDDVYQDACGAWRLKSGKEPYYISVSGSKIIDKTKISDEMLREIIDINRK